MRLTKIKTLAFSVLMAFGSMSIHAAESFSMSSSEYTAKVPGTSKSAQKKSTHNNRAKTTATKNSKWTDHTPKAAETASNDSLTLYINNEVLKWVPSHLNPGGLRVNLVSPNKDKGTVQVNLNENFIYLPINQQFISDLQKTVKQALPDSLSHFTPSLQVSGKDLSYYITNVQKLSESSRENIPFVREAKPDVTITKGMLNDKLALWHSHGRYFKNGSWQWQRPLLYQTAEDIYTMGYMLPFIVPMLENAGANVFLPKERDPNVNEVIVDNDINPDGQIYSQDDYREINGNKVWENGEYDGFIYDLPRYRDTENPFETGSYRQTQTIKSGKESVAAWYPDFPEDGEYAVYVSYKSLPNSTTDAKYTVHYSGGSKEFLVNQKMGGGTWIYLGTFPFESGYSDSAPSVTLSNITSGQAGTLVTADAIKFGGGMGNIERSSNRKDVFYDPSTPDDSYEFDEEGMDVDEEMISDTKTEDDLLKGKTTQKSKKTGKAPTFSTSNMPRFVEGARYWLHWAGFPEEVYSPYHGKDDYKDDYTGRSIWVNYLAGGSRVLPKEPGLKIPIDLAMALHSDAGKRADDSVVGTLGIYYTNGGGSYSDGTPRIISRKLTDMVMGQITGDIRQTVEPNWTRRSMWDKSYVEARVPEVPTTLIELMSHQNFGDMIYGLDPEFRFIVGRAIYKAMARFLAERKGRQVVIQPLPVKDFAIKRMGKNQYSLSWRPTPDKLEPTAMPNKYIIYERTQGELGFHKIAETKKTNFTVNINDNYIHSFKVVAANDGGVSFDSEILALREGTDNASKPILIINGFNRVGAPGRVNSNGQAGFDSREDFGVPYIRDISFSGYQTEFRRSAGERSGLSGNDYSTKVIAGNTFDYAALHGASILSTGYGFVSCSEGAVEAGDVKLNDYKIIDLILGKQKESTVGNGSSGYKYKTFPTKLRKDLTAFVQQGGRLLVTGQYIASDLYSIRSSREDRDFAADVLGIEPATGDKISNPRLTAESNSPIKNLPRNQFTYNNTLNDKMYIVESPDQLLAIDNAVPIITFNDNGNAAGVYNTFGKGKVVTMSIPFETLNDKGVRDNLMKQILTAFSN